MAYPAALPDFNERLAGFQSATFKQLRPGQRQVLTRYAAHYLTTPDVAIEMPTGEGKTLPALLIADYVLDQGRSVAYLTGTRQLAERVEDEPRSWGWRSSALPRRTTAAPDSTTTTKPRPWAL